MTTFPTLENNSRQQCQMKSTIIRNRLFLKYSKSKFVNQGNGINIVTKMPSEIANYFKLPNKNVFSGHCFRRTSATLLVNGEGDLIQLKNMVGGKAVMWLKDILTNQLTI